MAATSDHIILQSGRKLYVHMNLISIRFIEEDNKGWELYHGYDGQLNLTNWDYSNAPYNEEIPEFTKDELTEITTIMLNRWSLFKLAVLSGKVPVKE